MNSNSVKFLPGGHCSTLTFILGKRESLGENRAHSLFLSGNNFKCPAAHRLFFFSKIETTNAVL